MYWSLKNENTRFWCVTLLAAFIFATIISVIHIQWDKSHQTEICSNEECVQLARYISSNIDKRVEPCDDFFTYACGNYIPKYNGSTSVMDDLEEEVLSEISGLIEDIKETTDKNLQKMKTVYDSCMNSDNDSIPTFLSYLEKFGVHGWPRLSKDFSFKPSFEEAVGMMGHYYAFRLITFYPKLYERTFDGHTLIFASSAFESSFETQNFSLPDFEKTLSELLHYFSSDDNEINELVREYMETESDMFRLYKDIYLSCDRNCRFEEKLLDCESNLSPEWRLLCNALKFFVSHHKLSDYYSSRYVSVEVDHERILSFVLKTPGRSMANNFAVSYLLATIPSMDKRFWRFEHRIPKMMSNYKHDDDDRRHCAMWMTNEMPHYTAKLYFQKKVSNNFDKIKKTVLPYEDAAEDFVSEIRWMNESERKLIKSKGKYTAGIFDLYHADSSSSIFSYKMDESFPTKSNFYRNSMEEHRITELFYLKYYHGLSEIEKKIFWRWPFGNSYGSMLNLAWFLPPIYEENFPRLLNMVNLGFWLTYDVGREISYKISKSEREYSKRKPCIEKQYLKGNEGKNKEDRDHEYRLSTKLEDAITIQMLDKVIETHIRSDSFSLPNLNLDAQQIALVSFAQMWCTTSPDFPKKYSYKAPNRRAMIMLRNSKAFSAAFNCRRGTFMNPDEKCLLAR